MKKSIIYLMSVCFLVFILSAFSSKSDSVYDHGPLKIGDYAPNFILEGSDGKTYQLSDFKGKIVVLDFWAMWCAPCKKKMPKIQKLHETYSDMGVAVLGMLAMNKGAEEKAKTYFAENEYSFKLLYGNDELTKNYELKFLPTVVVVDKEGKIVYLTTKPNPNEFEDITAIVEKYK
ncbi:peroxiredoxin family protein [Maribacter sp. 2304DJ31-5]|uniref:peroxiredoxin family protein n=1 Tax=Maribacter sp. 2304DJ31-5 TaxID=3386273 RepID=UPI0039BC6437